MNYNWSNFQQNRGQKNSSLSLHYDEAMEVATQAPIASTSTHSQSPFIGHFSLVSTHKGFIPRYSGSIIIWASSHFATSTLFFPILHPPSTPPLLFPIPNSPFSFRQKILIFWDFFLVSGDTPNFEKWGRGILAMWDVCFSRPILKNQTKFNLGSKNFLVKKGWGGGT